MDAFLHVDVLSALIGRSDGTDSNGERSAAEAKGDLGSTHHEFTAMTCSEGNGSVESIRETAEGFSQFPNQSVIFRNKIK